MLVVARLCQTAERQSKGAWDHERDLATRIGVDLGPLAPHEHWHIDASYINIFGTFFYLCALLDGCELLLKRS
jgi:hypothetical protein